MTVFNTAIYNGENIYLYKMNENEKQKTETLRKELIECANRLELPKSKTFNGEDYEGRFKDSVDYKILFKEEYGYFLIEGERGKFEIVNGFPAQTKALAFFLLMKQEIGCSSFQFELNNRDFFKQEWEDLYSIQYDSRKAAFEFSINKLKEAFDYIDEDLIKLYESYLNNRDKIGFWKFDRETMKFLHLE